MELNEFFGLLVCILVYALRGLRLFFHQFLLSISIFFMLPLSLVNLMIFADHGQVIKLTIIQDHIIKAILWMKTV